MDLSISAFPTTRYENRYSTGSTSSVNNVDEIIPPVTTVASGRCTSAPVPTLNAMGTNPRLATSAVMSAGRRRRSAPWTMACSSAVPPARSC